MSNDNALTDVTEVAAVDIGSNSIHIIVARQVNGALQPLIADKYFYLQSTYIFS